MANIHPTQENWRAIPGFEGLYQVSDQGRVRSLDRMRLNKVSGTARIKGRMLKIRTNKDGYQQVGLYKNGKQRMSYVHAIVCLAFYGPRPLGAEVCHNDGNPSNNHLSNLRYDTSSANSYDVVKHGNHVQANKTHCKRGHKLEGENLRPYTLREGHRGCLACSRATIYLYKHPELRDKVQELSDAYYEKIMGEYTDKHTRPIKA